jgi:hypothetical protein
MILLSFVVFLTTYCSLCNFCVFQRGYITNPESQEEEKFQEKDVASLKNHEGSIRYMLIWYYRRKGLKQKLAKASLYFVEGPTFFV